MVDYIENALKKTGPCLAPKLIAELQKQGLSADAARKQIQRAQARPFSEVLRLAGVRFEKNARFYYLENQYGDERFWNNFEEACKSSGMSYWAALSVLKARGGAARKDFFERVAGVPVARNRQLSPERVYVRLEAINLLKTDLVGTRPYVSFKPFHYGEPDYAQIQANELAEQITLRAICDWAKKIGLGSYNKFLLRGNDNSPTVSGLVWDFTAPSYARPLVSVNDATVKPGFIVGDINLYDVIGKDEAAAFVRKCDLASAPKKVAPIMPMLVGHVFSTEALSFLKGHGILAITVENFLGKEIAKALKSLVAMLTDLGAKVSANPDALTTVMDELSKIEGAAANLSGDLFELVIGCLVKDVEGGYLKTGQKLRDPNSGRVAEVDVELDRENDGGYLVIECKAKMPNARVSEKDIKRWYNDRVPLIYSILSSGGTYTKKPFHFELWTNGTLTKSGKDWLKEQPKQCNGYTVGWKEGKELKKYADGAKNASLRKMLNEHYFRSAI